MHIPSERIHQEMRSEDAALWIVPANNGDDIAVLIKVPSSSIKALIAGCSCTIVLGMKDKYLCSCLHIFDTPDSPVLISGVQLHIEEHEALIRLLHVQKSPVFLFNEMDICLAWTNLTISEDSAKAATLMIGNISELYTGPFDNLCSHSLDCFCISNDNSKSYPNAISIPTVTLDTNLEPWKINSNVFIGARESHEIIINEKNEGEIFERAIWASLESVFPMTIYKSPRVIIGEKERELTDILSYHEYGAFMIEAKDLSVLEAGFERNIYRKTKGTQKQVKKAIGQLVGSHKAFKRGELIFDGNGNELYIDRTRTPHCIILITELLHFGDWSEIETELVNAMQSTGAYFHLLDLREFIKILKGSYGKSNLLDYNLIERCKSFIRCGSVHMRSQIAPTLNSL